MKRSLAFILAFMIMLTSLPFSLTAQAAWWDDWWQDIVNPDNNESYGPEIPEDAPRLPANGEVCAPWVLVDDSNSKMVKAYDPDGTPVDSKAIFNAGINDTVCSSGSFKFFMGSGVGHLINSTSTTFNNVQGAYVEFTFSGTAVALLSQFHDYKDISADLQFFMDDKLVGVLYGDDYGSDSYDGTHIVRKIYFEMHELEETEHVLRIMTSSAGQASVDAFAYIPCGQTETEAPDSSEPSDGTLPDSGEVLDPWVMVDDSNTDMVKAYMANGALVDTASIFTAGNNDVVSPDGQFKFFMGSPVPHLINDTSTNFNYYFGSYVEFTFTGTAVALLSQYHEIKSYCSNLHFFIDGDLVGGISAEEYGSDAYDGTHIQRKVYFQTSGLTPGQHVLKIMNASAGTATIDAFAYIPCDPSEGTDTEAPETVAPTVTLLDEPHDFGDAPSDWVDVDDTDHESVTYYNEDGSEMIADMLQSAGNGYCFGSWQYFVADHMRGGSAFTLNNSLGAVEFRFTGTAVAWITNFRHTDGLDGKPGPASSVAYYLDGKLIEEQAANPSTSFEGEDADHTDPTIMWQISGLSEQEHVLRIQATTRGYITIDSFSYVPCDEVSAPTYKLYSGDSAMTLTVMDNRVHVTSLSTNASMQNHANTSPVAINLPEYYISSTSYSKFSWTYVGCEEASLENAKNGQYGYVFKFEDKTAKAEYDLIVTAHALFAGPFEFTGYLHNNGSAIDIIPGSYFNVGVKGSGTPLVWTFNKESGLAEGFTNYNGQHYGGTGIYKTSLTSSVTASYNTNQDWNMGGQIPMLYVDYQTYGVYCAHEWTNGRITATKGNTGGSAVISTELGSGTFQTKVEGGTSFYMPTVYFGIYDGDVDEGSNVFKRWFLYNKAPSLLLTDPNEPLVQQDMQIDIQSAPYGVQAIKWDYGWWSNQSVGSWKSNEGLLEVHNSSYLGVMAKFNTTTLADFVKVVRNANLTLTTYILTKDTELDRAGVPTSVGTYGRPEWFANRIVTVGKSADFGNVECVEFFKGYLLNFFKETGVTTWRSDFEPICRESNLENRHYAYGGDVQYWCSVGFYDIVDYLYDNLDYFRYESCCSGGAMKDFSTMTRAVILNCDDSANFQSLKMSFYDSSYCMHPAQLQLPTNSGTYIEGTQYYTGFGDHDYGLRSQMVGAVMLCNWDGTTQEDIASWQRHLGIYNAKVKPLIKYGDLYHVLPRPDGVNWDGFFYVDLDAETSTKGVLMVFKPSQSAGNSKTIKLRGLDRSTTYRIVFQDHTEQNVEMIGAELMDTGLTVTFTETYDSDWVWVEADTIPETPDDPGTDPVTPALPDDGEIIDPWVLVDDSNTDMVKAYDADGNEVDVKSIYEAGINNAVSPEGHFKFFMGDTVGHLINSTSTTFNSVIGASVEFTFNGTAVALLSQYHNYSYLCSNLGFYIDGNYVGYLNGSDYGVDTYDTADHTVRKVYFQISGLTPGQHTFRVENYSSGQACIDAFAYIPCFDDEDYTEIYTKEDLNSIRENLVGHYVLMNDIVFTEEDFAEGGDFYNDGAGWLPIGTDASAPFIGIFDGNGYSVKNLRMNMSAETNSAYSGLFGYVKNAIIKNLSVQNIDVTLSNTDYLSFAGAIVGVADGSTSITDCYSTGSISADAYCGGVVGATHNDVTISNCYSICDIKSELFLGAIAGYSGENTVIVNCYYPDSIDSGVGKGSDTAVSLSEEQMTMQESFDGFDFDLVWSFDVSGAYPYPIFYHFASVGGTITVTNDAQSGNVNISLWVDGKDTAVYTAVVPATQASYLISEVSSGAYTVKVTKIMYVTRSYTIDVNGSDVTLDIELWQCGDMNGDGAITAKDQKLIYSYMNSPSAAMLDAYAIAAGDIDGDGQVTAKDKKMMYNHIAGIYLLW